MRITLIAAVARNGVIGTAEGGIPWHLPRDIQHFREYTQGKPLLLGRKTFAEMQGWFADHSPIVMTLDRNFQTEIAFVAHDMAAAIEYTQDQGREELVVCGGAEIYDLSMPFATDLMITFVDAKVAGSVYFPDFESIASWLTISQVRHEADSENAHAVTFCHFKRIES
ncbi:MAG: dihydrofolate reductase [Verrucomicrobiota bacterium]